MTVPSPPLRAGMRRPAGLSHTTVRPDVDFETYSEAGYLWDAAANKWQAPPGASQGKKGLPIVGAAVYAQHPSTEVLCAAYDLKDGRGKQFWHPGMGPPQNLLDYVAAGGELEAWNTAFEWWIWNEVCTRRYGWPPLPQQQTYDAMAKSRAHALPGALGKVSEVLALRHGKDPEGDRLLKKFAMPRNPTKSDPRRRIVPDFDDPADEDAQRLKAYNLRDIEAEFEASWCTPDLCVLELPIWRSDQRINRRGVAIDLDAVAGAIQIIEQAQEQYGREMHALTGCYPTQLQQLKGWLGAQGVHLDTMDEDAIEAALQDPFMPENARRALEIRATVGSASIKKVFAMRNQVAADGRLHDLYTYHGAHTGRPTGNGPQPTNLPKAGPDVWHCKSCGHWHNTAGDQCPWCFAPHDRKAKREEWNPEAMEDAIAVSKLGSLAAMEWIFSEAMLALAGTLRGLFIAAPGHDFISSDYSAIEGVVIAALAGEEWRLDVFRSHGMIYEMSAAKTLGVPFEEFTEHKKSSGKHHPARSSIGKPTELGLGFGGWIGALKAFGADKYFDNDASIKDTILAWRAASPAIVYLWGGQRIERTLLDQRTEVADEWTRAGNGGRFVPCLYGLEGAAVHALQNPDTEVIVYRLDGKATQISYVYRNDVLYCRVPSGGLITYHRPRLRAAEDAWRGLSISYEGWNTNPKNGPPGWIRKDLYGGRMAENVVQRVARDIQMNAIEGLEASGYPVVLHTYDEVVCEVPEGYGSVEELEGIMASLPDWARGWPIKAAGGWRAKRYRKG
jgi:DNA polymerase